MSSNINLDWFPFFLRDFDEGTRELTNEEVGAYLRLLYYHFHNGSIPADRARAGYITGEALTEAVWATLTQKFLADGAPPGRLVNMRMANVRSIAEASFKRRSEANKVNGMKGGLARAERLRTRAGAQSQRIASESLTNGKQMVSEPQPSDRRSSSILGEEKNKTGGRSKAGVSAGKSVDTPNSRARRSRRAPEDYKISDELGKWLLSKFPGVHVDTLRAWTAKQLEKFKNHEFASPRSDWDATLRNWVLTCIDKADVPKGIARNGGDEEKAWQDTLKTAAVLSMEKEPDETREAFSARVNERNQRRIAALESKR